MSGICRRAVVAVSLLVCAASTPGRLSADGPVVRQLQADYRHGQVFLAWQEGETPPDTTLNVYTSPSPITAASLRAATLAGHHIEAHSARDWWQDPASFEAGAVPSRPAGLVIESGKAPLDPVSGLFVYTVSPADPARLYFAVTATGPEGKEDTVGLAAISSPVHCKVEPIQAIWQGVGPELAPGSGRNMPVFLNLHYSGGGATAFSKPSAAFTPPNYLLFGDARMGWRQGLPMKFWLSVKDHAVTLSPSDRVWTGMRPGSRPGKQPLAVQTWWFGYPDQLYRAAPDRRAVIHNYTERAVLAMLHWTQSYVQADRPATYVTGGSMGGSGAVALCLHYPREFAAGVAEVPMVRFVTQPIRTVNRLENLCGMTNPGTMMDGGTKLLDYVDGVTQVHRATADLPYLFMIHGRRDASIPWIYVPSFYRALSDAHQGFSASWADAGHQDTNKHLAPELRYSALLKTVTRYRLDASMPVLSECSDDKNYGKGDPADGDPVGWVNRGLDWKDVVDTKSCYAITILMAHPQIAYPVTAMVSLRGLQQFPATAGQPVEVRVGGQAPQTLTVGAGGVLSIPHVVIPGKDGVRIELARP